MGSWELESEVADRALLEEHVRGRVSVGEEEVDWFCCQREAKIGKRREKNATGSVKRLIALQES